MGNGELNKKWCMVLTYIKAVGDFTVFFKIDSKTSPKLKFKIKRNELEKTRFKKKMVGGIYGGWLLYRGVQVIHP